MAEAVDIPAFPWFLHKPIELDVEGVQTTIKITASEWAEHWRPFLIRLHERQQKHPQRMLVAIVGCPGSGDSVLAAQLNWFIFKGFVPGCYSVALPMNGFLQPQIKLDEQFRTLPDGTKLKLSRFRGAPETYDADMLRRHLDRLKAAKDEMIWPGYNRLAQTMVPNAFRISTKMNVVFVQGHYLLLDKPPFQGIRDYFDLKVYVDAPPVTILGNLMQQHLRAGLNVNMAKERVKENDLPNAQIVGHTKDHADVILERDRQSDIAAIHWKH